MPSRQVPDLAFVRALAAPLAYLEFLGPTKHYADIIILCGGRDPVAKRTGTILTPVEVNHAVATRDEQRQH